MKTKVFYSAFHLMDFTSVKYCIFRKKKVTNSEVLIFFKSVCEFFNIYDNIVQCLESSLHAISNQRKDFINMINIVKKGSSFSSALQNTDIVSTKIIHIIQAGESNNDLLGSLRLTVDFLEKSENQKSELFKALIYPVFTFFAFFSTIITFSKFVIPSLMECVMELNENMCSNFILITRIFFGLEIGFYFLLISLLILFSIYKFRIDWFESICLKIPFFCDFFIYSNIYLFCYYMKISLKNGLSVGESLDISIDSFSLKFKKVLQNAKKKLLTGNELSYGLSFSNLVPPLFLDILKTGEKSNNLFSSFEIAENLFKSKQDSLVSKTITILPIILITFISFLLICFIYFLFLPLYGLGG